MSLRKILENLTLTSKLSNFDQNYVHTCLASPAPFTVTASIRVQYCRPDTTRKREMSIRRDQQYFTIRKTALSIVVRIDTIILDPTRGVVHPTIDVTHKRPPLISITRKQILSLEPQ